MLRTWYVGLRHAGVQGVPWGGRPITAGAGFLLLYMFSRTYSIFILEREIVFAFPGKKLVSEVWYGEKCGQCISIVRAELTCWHVWITVLPVPWEVRGCYAIVLFINFNWNLWMLKLQDIAEAKIFLKDHGVDLTEPSNWVLDGESNVYLLSLEFSNRMFSLVFLGIQDCTAFGSEEMSHLGILVVSNQGFHGFCKPSLVLVVPCITKLILHLL